MIDVELTEALKAYRINKGWTQRDMADKVRINISSYRNAERGMVTPKTRVKLRAYLETHSAIFPKAAP